MASPLKCDICEKPATVHLTQILNNQAHKVDLCEDCARAKGITDSSDFSLADLLINEVSDSVGVDANGDTYTSVIALAAPAARFTTTAPALLL